MNQIEHIGIAVLSLEDSIPVYEKMLGSACYKMEIVESEMVRTAFFKTGNEKIELLESLDTRSAISRFIEKRGEGLHHIAYDVDDIESEMKRLREDGFILLNEVPKAGADNKLICFVHPKSTHGVLMELCMERPVDVT